MAKTAAVDAICADHERLAQMGAFDPQAVMRALAVLIQTAHIREYLMEKDPKALEQARRALGLEGRA